MPLGVEYHIGSNEEVRRLLYVSARYLKRSKRIKGEIVSKLKIENAIISSIFSAAAIEAGVNIFLKLPILAIEDEYIQNLYGYMLNEIRALSAPRKIQLVSKFCRKLINNKKLVRDVEGLFSYRNRILHVSPEYVEQLGLPDDLFLEESEGDDFRNNTRSKEISIEQLARKPAIIFSPPGDMSLRAAVEHYYVAEEFLKGLVSFEK
jgi:hypothetical protein